MRYLQRVKNRFNRIHTSVVRDIDKAVAPVCNTIEELNEIVNLDTSRVTVGGVIFNMPLFFVLGLFTLFLYYWAAVTYAIAVPVILIAEIYEDDNIRNRVPEGTQENS